ncbi:zinc finger protein 391-like [Syngnathoides biaculeatus]|uniref:zinc finger protein 391-like n=1 Tax=Syngnathoides biaculeatus TaxID=300417 RepID=UPI002ADE0CE1|nr:zinc finger protein 391-like [Syngnathoides biaculeatus]
MCFCLFSTTYLSEQFFFTFGYCRKFNVEMGKKPFRVTELPVQSQRLCSLHGHALSKTSNRLYSKQVTWQVLKVESVSICRHMSPDVHTQLAAVMESLVHAAVAELHKQHSSGGGGGGDGGGPPADLRRGEAPPWAASVHQESREQLVCFAAILETLANEALGKIINIVDGVDPRRTVSRADGSKMPQIAIVRILNKACVEEEHSYGIPPADHEAPTLAKEEPLEETPLIPAVSVKDQHGCVDLDAIAERARLNTAPLASWDSKELAADGVTHKRKSSSSSSRLASWSHVPRETSSASPDRARLQPHGANEKPFACELCGRRFTLKQNLRRHARGHTGTKSFCCGACGKGFTRAVTLKIHQLIHTGQKPLKCDQCPKTFRYAVNLKNHLRVHTGARPFACDVCPKTFCQAVNLKIHRRVHTGERPYACRRCGKTFSQQSSLTAHGRTHSAERPFACASCAKRFNSANGLKLHVRVHTGERPYACDVCAKTFSQGSHLRTHKSHLHAGGKRFICDRCGKRYADGRNLKTHKCGYA